MEVLISCMNASPLEIIQKTGICSDVVIVNQCNEECKSKILLDDRKNHAIIINTRERGLSRSRNMAIRNATADICLLCDDDEVLEPSYVDNIVKVFEENKDADLITFKLEYSNKKYPHKKKNIGYLAALKVSSVQIAFRRKRIIDNNLWFNEQLGAGTGNGAGEENKFLFDCLDAGLKILFFPINIGKVLDSSKSSWFEGYNNHFFENRGWSNKIIFGTFYACLYDLYFSLFKFPLYKNENSFFKSLFYQLKGTFKNKKI